MLNNSAMMHAKTKASAVTTQTRVQTNTFHAPKRVWSVHVEPHTVNAILPVRPTVDVVLKSTVSAMAIAAVAMTLPTPVPMVSRTEMHVTKVAIFG